MAIWAGATTSFTQAIDMDLRGKLDRSLRWFSRCVTEICAQQLLPADRQEIADQERLSWTLKKFPPQPYMNEIYWPYSRDTPAFFRDSLVQFVARTYYLTRDNFDGSKSQAWAGGGWLAFRSGLIGDMFGVHVAGLYLAADFRSAR